MPGIGYITTTPFDSAETNIMLPTDESVCGLLFDISDFVLPFSDFSYIEKYLGNEQTVVINNIEEAAMYGLDDTDFLNGIVYYHIKQFYDYVGADAPLYICLTTDTKEWSAIEQMQMAANGKIFQIGIWTSKYIWGKMNNALVFTTLIDNIETAVQSVSGKVGDSSLKPTPLNVILSANTALDTDSFSLLDIPDGTVLNYPKISVCLVQNGTDEVHTIQSNNPNKAPLGCIGLVMACLNLAYAEECIGYVGKFNLNKNDDFEYPEIPFCDDSYSVDDIAYVVGNTIVERGYITPCKYAGKENEFFFSGDSTFSTGDYCKITRSRIMHKCRRVINSALMPYLHNSLPVDVTSGGLSASSKSMITDSVRSLLESTMVNSLGESQIDGITLDIDKDSDILSNDSIRVNVSVDLLDYNQTLNEQDDFEV